MNLPDGSKLHELGVDWLTCTAKSTDGQRNLRRQGEKLIEEAIEAGEVVRTFRWKGYEGFCVGGCDIGSRYDSSIVRLHGMTAALNWFEVFQESENTTRLDLQTTWSIPEGNVDAVLARAFRAVRRAKVHGKKIEWHYRRDSSKGDTLELGRRVSALFGRAYNKEKQSKLEHYKGCFRLELEAHHDEALRRVKSLGMVQPVKFDISAQVSEYFAARSICSPAIGDPSRLIRRCEKFSDLDSYLRWLTTSVRPGVKRAVVHRGVNAVLEALGLSDVAEESVNSTYGPSGPLSKGE